MLSVYRRDNPGAPAEHSPWLDWIRFLAALIVFLTHTRDVIFVEFSLLEASSQNLAVAAFYVFTRLGTEAVMVFFVLSGFLVGGPTFDRVRAGSFDISRYVVDRIVRILVPLFPAVVITVVVGLIIGNEPELVQKFLGHTFSIQGAYVPLFNNNIPLWSLAYEVWFYIIAGSLALIATKAANTIGKLLAFIFLGLSILIFLELKVLYLVIWAMGALAYVFRPLVLQKRQVILGFALLLFGIGARQISKSSSFFSVGESGLPYGVAVGEMMIAAGMCFIIANLFLIQKFPGKIGALGGVLASFSFSLYLIHQPILRLWPVQNEVQINAWTISQFFIAAVFILMCAWLYARIFEKSGFRIKSYVFSVLSALRPRRADS